MMFLKLFLIVLVLLAVAFAGLAIKILMEKKGQFPSLHIGSNKHMKERGITCAQTFDKMEQARANRKFKFDDLNLLKNTRGGC